MRFAFLYFGFLSLVFSLNGCTQGGAGNDLEVDCNCSLIQLLVAPDKYDEKAVRVIGLAISAESQDGFGRIYLSENDARYLNDANSVWVDYRDTSRPSFNTFEAFNGKFVVVEGVFIKRGDFFVIEKVNDIRILEPLPLDASRFAPGN